MHLPSHQAGFPAGFLGLPVMQGWGTVMKAGSAQQGGIKEGCALTGACALVTWSRNSGSGLILGPCGIQGGSQPRALRIVLVMS